MLKGSIVALVTPFAENGAVDRPALQALVDWHLEAGTEALVIGGTTGESSSLSSDELLSIIELTLERVQGKIPVIVGNGAISTAKSIEITQQLNHLPINGFLCVTPYYVKPSQAGLIAHFHQVAEAAQHPLYLYNVPGRTCCDLINDSVFQLAEHENIVGIKDATGDIGRAKELIERVDGQFCLLSGDDATSFEFMQMGGHGVISVTSNVVPELMSQRCRLIIENRTEEAREIEQQIASLHQLLFAEANPIPAKWALSYLGKLKNNLRLPLTPLVEQRDALQAALDSL
ncbi:4-hydroxy-tetrahydrodipicolinate synthase [Pleionea sp. CnH1-48]|uniref:4-hydroxy-tetrahydrodipicolinate synthase n=1 Tax=Pleionea sp. CnH1-48 TaxID=2954494 RepID=UPI00209758F1|nr:4-hydroxy-tetrahydrodipicolinate synthase [Pleionea sp. CnH1-48]MCO7222998.1 4-hydroxy-tetrahydrodipicolinate synthase [Pleionea sp. CnH1-48]